MIVARINVSWNQVGECLLRTRMFKEPPGYLLQITINYKRKMVLLEWRKLADTALPKWSKLAPPIKRQSDIYHVPPDQLQLQNTVYKHWTGFDRAIRKPKWGTVYKNFPDFSSFIEVCVTKYFLRVGNYCTLKTKTKQQHQKQKIWYPTNGIPVCAKMCVSVSIRILRAFFFDSFPCLVFCRIPICLCLLYFIIIT